MEKPEPPPSTHKREQSEATEIAVSILGGIAIALIYWGAYTLIMYYPWGK